MRKILSCILAGILILTLAAGALAEEDWVCPSCGRVNSAKANFCGSCRTQKPSGNTATQNDQVNAWVCPACGNTVPLEDAFCSICGADHASGALSAIRREETAFEEVTIEPCPVKRIPMGQLTASGREIIPWQAEIDGRYRIWIEDQRAGSEFKLKVRNSLGQTVNHNDFYNYAPGLTVDLTAGAQYEIELNYQSVQGGCTLCVGIPRPPMYIGAGRMIRDSISFREQINLCAFTAEVSGGYRVEVTGMLQGNEINLKLMNEQGYILEHTSFGAVQGTGISADLEAGKTYFIQVTERNGPCTYELTIGKPNLVLDLSGADAVGDRLYYRDQKNVYRYTAPVSGQYTISVAYVESTQETVTVSVLDIQGYKLEGRTSMGRDSSFKVNLDAGVTYQLAVKQRDACGEYTLVIQAP